MSENKEFYVIIQGKKVNSGVGTKENILER